MKIIAQYESRLDKFLQAELKKPRNQVETFIKTHGIQINSKVINKCGFKLKTGDMLEFELPQIKQKIVHDIDFDIDIMYEDEDVLIINKPPFLVVHPAPSVKEPTLVDWLKYKGISLSTLSGEERHGIVHRIDKETSGALVIAKNNEAHQELSRQLEDKSMGRYYLAIVDLPLKENIVIERKISRNLNNRIKMAASGHGRDAKSAFLKIQTSKNDDFELIGAKLYTGRTHQIRAHLESISRHILGDTLYGFKSKKGKINRTMLHAYIIYFTHPRTKEVICKVAPLLEDFKDVLSKHFQMEKLNENIEPNNIVRQFDTTF